ncbi:hypothetical protein [Enterovibrio norvegicus]|uniref:hypothetical protein n=1 Tax=Enterovibrio norvegicus TaxID=188144 RepID=UPI00037E1652|nr:hypothetical protein [Enterovibrio norvegicus]OEF57944.1 hypothetical protein A1OU_06985 [Enterovibrio norvegicus]
MSMDFVANVFIGLCAIGFVSGLAAAIGLSGLHQYGSNVPTLLKFSGISVFFPKYYVQNEARRKVVARLILISLSCIFFGFLWLLITLPEARAAFWMEIFGSNI